MSERLPAWLAPVESPAETTVNGLPSWLTGAPAEVVLQPSAESKALLFAQYEMAFARILELVSSGYTVKKAFKTLPVQVDPGGFMQWLKKDPERQALYKNAKELRTEFWADDLIRFSEGKDEDGNETMEDVSRSRLKVDTLWKLMGADNRKQYGDTKTVDMNVTSISITAALEQAQSRVMAKVIDDDVIDADYKQLGTGEDDED